MSHEPNCRSKFGLLTLFCFTTAISIFFAACHYIGTDFAVVGAYLVAPYLIKVLYRSGLIDFLRHRASAG